MNHRCKKVYIFQNDIEVFEGIGLSYETLNAYGNSISYCDAEHG